MDNKHYDLRDYPTDQQAVGGRVESVVSEIYASVNSMECYDCEHITFYGYADTHTTCDIVNGQYTEFEALNCENCELENKV